MPSRRRSEQRGPRFLGITLLILSMIRVPLPQADYHNVRHHDAPGEVCVYHDHLLRWHPSADSAEDVSILHWHWFAPVVEPGAPPSGDSDEPHGPASGPALHAHLGDWPSPDWTGTPLIRPDARVRLIDLVDRDLNGLCPLEAIIQDDGLLPRMVSLSAWTTARADVARTEILDRISRWNC